MRRFILVLYLVLILLPAAVLSAFAFRTADQEYRDSLRAHSSRLEEEAAALARRIEGAISDGAGKGERALAKEERLLSFQGEDTGASADVSGEVIGFARSGEWIGYRPEDDPPQAEAIDEVRYYRLSLSGGESYELKLRDLARALDAYSFYLPRIHSEELRARLQFRMARTALAMGDVPLGKGLLQSVSRGNVEMTEEGIPISLLAALRLQELSDEENPLEEFRQTLWKVERRISTPLLAHLVGRFFREDPAFQEILEKRRALESAVRRHPRILDTREAVLEEGFLLLARSLAGPSRDSIRAVVQVPLELPALSAGDFQAHLSFEFLEPPSQDLPDFETILFAGRPVRLKKTGVELASLKVWDPGYGEKLQALAQRRDLQRILVGLLVILTLGGGVALFWAILRERHLAKLRGRLLANVSHELKTPITSIRMFSEMLAEDPLDENRTRRFGEHLRSESLRLSQLIENLLDFSRRRREEEPIPMEPVDLDALLRQVADGFSSRLKEEGFDFEMDNSAPAVIHTNAAALERILANLLDNALKYGGEERCWIRLRAEEREDRVLISVSDNGIGIRRRDRKRVFEEFYRVRYDDYAVQGSGLGLAISRQLARKLGGDITVESVEGKGSTFTLVLPKEEVT